MIQDSTAADTLSMLVELMLIIKEKVKSGRTSRAGMQKTVFEFMIRWVSSSGKVYRFSGGKYRRRDFEKYIKEHV